MSERMRGTPWAVESNLRDSLPVEMEDIRSGAADALAECLLLVESDMVAAWIGMSFGVPECSRYAPVLLDKWPSLSDDVSKYIVADSFGAMATPELAEYIDRVVELIEGDRSDYGRVAFVKALPLMGERGVQAAIALFGSATERFDINLIDGLKEARASVPSDVLDTWLSDPRTDISKRAKQLRRRAAGSAAG